MKALRLLKQVEYSDEIMIKYLKLYRLYRKRKKEIC